MDKSEGVERKLTATERVERTARQNGLLASTIASLCISWNEFDLANTAELEKSLLGKIQLLVDRIE